MKTKPKIVVILGPTATGKSDLAVELALKFNGEIISADSRQVYKGMDLGSGKITKKEMRDVPHHLLDVVNPNTYFSVAKYKKLAEKKIEEILSRNKPGSEFWHQTKLSTKGAMPKSTTGMLPIICGGTGFYIDSIAKNILLPNVPPNHKLRKKLEKKTIDELLKILKKLDSARAKKIDSYNKVRLIRAIEIAKTLGKVPALKELPSKYNFLFIGLDFDDKTLKERISLRLQKRIKVGMIKEVQKLHNSRVSWKRLESFGLEYRNTALFLQNKITLEQMIQNLEREIWQFVKRQRTWFKRNKRIIWLNPVNQKNIIKAQNMVNKFFRA